MNLLGEHPVKASSLRYSCEWLIKTRLLSFSTVNSAAQPTLNGRPYVQRHYEIAPDEPDENDPAATGTVTLYFTQAEFDAFNDFPGNSSFLPTGPGASGFLRVVKE